MEQPSIFDKEPSTTDALWALHMPSKLWRMNNLYTITDKLGNEIRFQMNYAQHKVYASSIKHSRLIILKSRQQGISTLWLVSFFDDSLVNDNYECGLMTMGQKESKSLFRRVKRLWDRLPEFVKDGLGVSLARDTKEEIGFNNGSVMFLQSSFRSGTLQRLHISELGKIAAKYPEKAEETRTGSLQAVKAGNTVIIESTAEGLHNMFHSMWYTASEFSGVRSGKDFYPVFLSWAEDPDCIMDIPQVINGEAENYFIQCEETGIDGVPIELTLEQKWWWVAQRRELDFKVFQEYPFSADEAFESVRDGTYYARLFREQVQGLGHVVTRVKDRSGKKVTYLPTINMPRTSPLWEPNLNVEVAMDLGINDTMVLVWFQRFKREIRLIDCYHNSGEGLAHYTNIMKEKPYRYGTIWAPHDAKVRELGTGMSRVGRFRELGVKVKVLRKVEVNTGIEQVRKMIPNIWIDSDLCGYIISMFFSYSKEWDSRLDTWKDKPLHNEWSNPADTIRYIAMSKGSGKDEGMELARGKTTLRSNIIDGMAL